MNTFTVPGWQADQTEQLTDGCESWCTALLHIIPAQVGGRWRIEGGELVLGQDFQMLSGSLTTSAATSPIGNGRMNGTEISFTLADTTYTGRVDGDRMSGTAAAPNGAKRSWSATRVSR
jgi:hypothetical protein